MNTIAVTGSSGQLGQELTFLAKYYPQFEWVFLDSEELDITNESMIRDVLEEYELTFIINCSAYTKVDQAESEPDRAFAVNSDGVRNLARYCAKNDLLLVHFSTDYVYNNGLNRPLAEDDVLSPKGVYAASKKAGEDAILDHCREFLIFRVSWLYSSFGHNFVKNMLNIASNRSEISVVYDQIGCPTYARDLGEKVMSILDRMRDNPDERVTLSGIYNISNSGVTSWYDFARSFIKSSGLSCKIQPILSEDYPTAAPRPYFSVFNQKKLINTFGNRLPHWEKSLAKCLKALKE